jgi:putative membrane-bound dehydrogenase-like protein
MIVLRKNDPEGIAAISPESRSAVGGTVKNQTGPPASGPTAGTRAGANTRQELPTGALRDPWLLAGTTPWFIGIGLLVGFALGRPAQAQEDFASELPRIPATEPADTIATFNVADGFRIEQVAAEPLVNSPVAIEWDANGYLYVCEMRGYSEDKDEGISRISRLEDTDDDGVFDQSVVFVDGLLWPTAIFPFDGGLFVGDAPNLYYFKDTDGDGKADSKKTVLTGFGTSNVQGLFNSFRWGLDNRIHVATSSTGGMIQRSSDDEGVNVRGRDIAFDPRTFEFELTSGAAQHGMSFDDWGRKFVSSNSDHLQQVMYEDRYIARNKYVSAPPARISIAADGPQAEVFRISPVEPWRIVRTRLRVSGTVSGPIEGGGRAAGYFTGATGVTIYRGDAWPEQWRGLAIIGDVGSNLIHRKQLEPNGLQFIGKRIDQQSEFVASKDIWFRPAQFANAPDGSLYAIDVYREVIEHPLSLPPQIKKHLDLTSGRQRGRIYRIVPNEFVHRKTPRLKDASTADLVNLLAHPNSWQRETAARLLFERQDQTAVPLLKDLARQSDSSRGRMHAIYALTGLNSLDAETLLTCLSADHPQVRRHAILLSEGSSDTDVLDKVTSMADDSSLDVRYQLAFSIGNLDSNDRLAVLGKIIRRQPNDRWVRAAVQSSLSEGAGDLFSELMEDQKFRSAGAISFLKQLASQIGTHSDGPDTAHAVHSLLSLSDSESSVALPIIGELLKHRRRRGSWLALMGSSGKLRPIDDRVAQMIRQSIEIATNDANDDARRVSAIDGLRFGQWDDVNETLVSLIDNRQPQSIQQTAITTLGRFNEAGVAKPILAAWPRLSPSVRETACDAMFARPDRLNKLFDAVDEGLISVGDISRARWNVAMNIKSVKTRALKYVDMAGSKARQEVVDSYQKSLTLAGNLERGRAAFRKHCAGCHQVEGHGHVIGPNLTAIKTRGPETILVNVLDPNREVNPQYLNYIVLTEDGRTVTGMIVSENANSVTLRRAESATDSVQRADIEQMKSTGLSIMPEGMEEAIDKQTLADIIEYLMKVGG